MAALPLEKTWEFINKLVVPQVDARTCARFEVFDFKEALKSFPTKPWTVRGSSDSVSAGLDGVDRILAPANWQAASVGGVHSWIVLRHPVGGFEILLDALYTTSNYEAQLRVMISPAVGFTGGSKTAAPTAADAFYLCGSANNGDYWSAADGSGVFGYAFHAMQSTDGKTTHVFIQVNGVTRTWFMVSELVDPVAGFTFPYVFALNGGNSGTSFAGPAGIGVTGSSQQFYGFHGGAAFRVGIPVFYMNSVVLPSDASFKTENAFAGGFPIMPAAIASRVAGRQGFLGRIPDLWTGLDNTVEGRTYPGDATRQLVQFGVLIVPWNGTIPLIQ